MVVEVETFGVKKGVLDYAVPDIGNTGWRAFRDRIPLLRSGSVWAKWEPAIRLSRMVISNKNISLVIWTFLLVTHKLRFTKFRSYQLIWDLSSIKLNDRFLD
jgi:hypothetical protein